MTKMIVAIIIVIVHVGIAASKFSNNTSTIRKSEDDKTQIEKILFLHEEEPCLAMPVLQDVGDIFQDHIDRIRGLSRVISNERSFKPKFSSGELLIYMDTVLTPYLDTYYRYIQSTNQGHSTKVLDKIKEAINHAVNEKQRIYNNLTQLANQLEVPKMCDEERRSARTKASEHVAKMYQCTEAARAAIDKVGVYSDEIIAITRNHMEATVRKVSDAYDMNNTA